MASEWKTVPVFISSTFTDMHAERDHLVRFVFPRLREELLKWKLHLVDVDLRWGVTSADAVRVCQQIIDECRPRFLCMLGDRYGSVPEGETESVTASEIHYADLVSGTITPFFYFRDPATTAEAVEAYPGEFREPEGSDGQLRCQALKQEILAAGVVPKVYTARWDATLARFIGLEAFGQLVYADLLESIRRENLERLEAPTDEVTRLREAMESFIDERADAYVEGVRAALCQELDAFVSNNSNENLLALVGDAGSGKSALLARLLRRTESRLGESAVVLGHFVGASPGSTDLRQALQSFCAQLAPFSRRPVPPAQTTIELIQSFAQLLRDAAAVKRVVLIIDAINQLDPGDHAHAMRWLPINLPKNVRIVVSSLESPILLQLRRRFRPSEAANASAQSALRKAQRLVLGIGDGMMERNLAPLSAGDSAAIVEAILSRYHKQVTHEQMSALLAKPDGVKPLYLTLAVEELRSLGTYQEIGEKIEQLPGTIQALFRWIICTRLPSEPALVDERGQLVGAALVERLATSLACSRGGLSSREITDLIEPGDRAGNVAALLRFLRPYLIRRGPLLDFYHGEFQLTVMAEFLSTAQASHVAHQRLAEYFRRQGISSPRALSELPYHLSKADLSEQVTEVLTSLSFIEAKLTYGMAGGLLADFNQALATEGLAADGLESLHDFAAFVRGNIHVLASDPSLTFQQAANEPVGTAPALAAISRQKQRLESRPWLQWLNKPRSRSSRVLTIAADVDGVAGCALSADGQRLYTVGHYGVVRIWDTWTGVEISNVDAARARVTGMALSPTEDRLAVLTEPGLVRIIDLATLTDVPNSPGIHAGVQRCAFDPSGKTLVTVGAKVLPNGNMVRAGNLHLWTAETGAKLQVPASVADKRREATLAVRFTLDRKIVVVGGFMGVKTLAFDASRGLPEQKRQDVPPRTCAACSADGLRAVWGTADGSLIIQSVADGKTVPLQPHSCRVSACAFSDDGRWVATGASDGSVSLVDVSTHQVVGGFAGHASTVQCCVFANDGKTLVTGSADGTVILWTVASASFALEATPQHSKAVSAAAHSPSGDRVATGADDGTLRIWRRDGVHLRMAKLGSTRTIAIAFTPDERHVLALCRDGSLWRVEASSGRASLIPLPKVPSRKKKAFGERLKDAAALGVYGLSVGLLAGVMATGEALYPALITVGILSLVVTVSAGEALTSGNIKKAVVNIRGALVAAGFAALVIALFTHSLLASTAFAPAGFVVVTACLLLGESGLIPREAVASASFSPSGTEVVVGRTSGELAVVPIDPARPALILREVEEKSLKEALLRTERLAPTLIEANSVVGTAFSSDGEIVYAAISSLERPEAYQLPSGQTMGWPAAPGICTALAVSPSKSHLALSCVSGILVYSSQAGELELTIQAVPEPRSALAFRTEASIAIGSTRGDVAISAIPWKAADYVLSLGQTITTLAFNTKGDRLVVGDALGRVNIFELENLPSPKAAPAYTGKAL